MGKVLESFLWCGVTYVKVCVPDWELELNWGASRKMPNADKKTAFYQTTDVPLDIHMRTGMEIIRLCPPTREGIDQSLAAAHRLRRFLFPDEPE